MTKYKRSASSYALIVGFMSLIVVGAWLFFQVFSALTKSQVTGRQQQNIAPLESTIKEEVINDLDSRRRFGLSDFNNVSLNEASSGATIQAQ